VQFPYIFRFFRLPPSLVPVFRTELASILDHIEREGMVDNPDVGEVILNIEDAS